MNFEITKAKEIKEFFAIIPNEMPNTIRYTSTEDENIMYNAINGGAEKIENYIGEVVEVNNIIVTSANLHTDKDDEESPVENRPCINFFTTDGKHISTISNGIVRSVENLYACDMIPTPERPRKIKFVTIDTNKGTSYSIELVM